MHVFLIAALTADGFIAKGPDHKADWTSAADKKFFRERTKQAGVVIMGARTYRTIGQPLPDRRTIVYTDSQKFEGVENTAEPPEVLLARLEQAGVREVAICGGASIYTLFMEAKLVDTLYLTVEPTVFGTGISLFNKPLNQTLRLVSTSQIGEGGVLLEYSTRS